MLGRVRPENLHISVMQPGLKALAHHLLQRKFTWALRVPSSAINVKFIVHSHRCANAHAGQEQNIFVSVSVSVSDSF
jgi:hypothetical protein